METRSTWDYFKTFSSSLLKRPSCMSMFKKLCLPRIRRSSRYEDLPINPKKTRNGINHRISLSRCSAKELALAFVLSAARFSSADHRSTRLGELGDIFGVQLLFTTKQLVFVN